MNLSRRQFCSLSANAALAGFAARITRAQNADFRPMDVDLIVSNAKVYTVDSRIPRAEAFAVKNGRFVAVGSLDEMKGLTGRMTRSYEAKGMIVLPGFIDTHNHGGGEGLLYEVLVGNPYDVEFVTIDSIVEKLQARAAPRNREAQNISAFEIAPAAPDSRIHTAASLGGGKLH
jgi:predicted amidohydrolase YtcJ